MPVWVAGFYGKPRPLRRAARYQGFFPVNLAFTLLVAWLVPAFRDLLISIAESAVGNRQAA